MEHVDNKHAPLALDIFDRSTCLAKDQLAYQLFEQQVQRTPDAAAVVFEDSLLTYSELNARANQLAHYLVQQGVVPEMLIGIGINRSPELAIAILAISKVGAAYLCFDPHYPVDRLHYMLQDAHIALLLSSGTFPLSLSTGAIHTIDLQQERVALASLPAQNLDMPYAPEHMAYLIYTSGSTGQPKGVQVAYRGIGNLGITQAQAFQVQTYSRVLQCASWSFDASVSELWMTLLAGAVLVMATAEQLRPGHEFITLLQTQAITMITVSPSLLLVLPSEALPQLSTLVVAGEASSVEVLRPWTAGRQCYNAYGPTEITVCASLGRFLPEHEVVSLGGPLPGLELYLLDEQMQPVATTTDVGELYVGGCGLARGYLNRPDSTAERFVPHPYSQQPGARLYRTGDLARLHTSGALEYVGRIDQQIKLRGHRIEPGEIEHHLRQHAAVQDALVLVWDGDTYDRRLVAYIIPAPSATSSLPDELITYLQDQLPAYLIPAHIIPLAAWPITPNGKIDRNSLPAPTTQFIRQKPGAGDLPRTTLEHLLVEIWSEVLQRRVGIHDNFFLCGGHSLLATRAISRIGKALQIELPVSTLFAQPTVTTLAAHIAPLTTTGTEYDALVPVARDTPIPLSYPQQRLWVHYVLQPEDTSYNMYYPLRIHGPLQVRLLQQSLTKIITRHEVLRTVFTVLDEQPVQLLQALCAPACPFIDATALEREASEQLVYHCIHTVVQQPFDLFQGPLLRTLLIRIRPDEHVFLLTIHHSIFDAWSYTIFMQEFLQCYTALHAGIPVPWQPLPVQYADFAHWQRQRLQGGVLERLLTYWHTHLAGAVAVQLPVDYPRPALSSSRTAREIIHLSPELSAALVQLSTQEQVTVFMTLLAAFQILLFRYTAQEDIVIGTDIASRTRPELEHLIGFFVNLLVLRTRVQRTMSFLDHLRSVRDMVIHAYAHQDLPFDKLVEALHLPRTLHETPLVRVLFVLQETGPQTLHAQDMTIEPINFARETGPFDLAVFLWKGPEGFTGVARYKSDLFKGSTIQKLIQHYTAILEQCIACPTERIEALELTTREEKVQQQQEKAAYHDTQRRRLQAVRRQNNQPSR